MNMVTKEEVQQYVQRCRKDLEAGEKALAMFMEEERQARIAEGKSQFKAKFQEAWDNHELEPYWGGDGSMKQLQNITIDLITEYRDDMRMSKANVLRMLDFWDDVMYL